MQDSDEVLSPELIEWLSSAVETAPASVGAYLIPRENLIDGKPIGKATHEEHLRLFRSRFRYAPRLHESPQVDRGYGVGKGPAAGVILHHKTSLQQNRANARYTVDPTGGQKGPVRLNLGCGGRILDSSQGWINVDARDDIPGVDYVYDFTPRMNWNEHIYPYPGCLPWADNSVDEVYATHVLEHFIYHHMSDVIRDWVRVLKPGGRIEIAVPDYDDIVHRYVRGANTYLESIQLIFGGETDRFNTHFNAMDEAVLTGQLISFGCSQTSIRRLPAGSDREVRLEGRKANA
jgi:SAM-dependent methyltransferase